MKILYRYDKTCYEENLTDAFNNNNVEIICHSYNIIKETDKFYIIDLGSNRLKRVSKDAPNAWGFTTKEKALKCFVERSRNHIKLCRLNIKYTELAIKKAIILLSKKIY